jgi:hypothetical protein
VKLLLPLLELLGSLDLCSRFAPSCRTFGAALSANGRGPGRPRTSASDGFAADISIRLTSLVGSSCLSWSLSLDPRGLSRVGSTEAPPWKEPRRVIPSAVAVSVTPGRSLRRLRWVKAGDSSPYWSGTSSSYLLLQASACTWWARARTDGWPGRLADAVGRSHWSPAGAGPPARRSIAARQNLASGSWVALVWACAGARASSGCRACAATRMRPLLRLDSRRGASGLRLTRLP